MTEAATNGLGEFVAIANLSCVAVLLLVAVWFVMKGLPAYLDRQERNEERRDKLHSDMRSEFIGSLDRQTAARSEAAKGGHDAAMRIADNLHDLTEEVRRANSERTREGTSLLSTLRPAGGF